MSYKSSQTVSRQSLSVQTAFRVSPAKARKLENVMRGGNIKIQHGITQIGFGNDAVDVNDIYPIDNKISTPEDVKMSSRINSPKDSLIGRKRVSNEVPLPQLFNNNQKRHCIQNNDNNIMEELLQLKTDNNQMNYELELSHKRNNNLDLENICLKKELKNTQISLNKHIEIRNKYESEKKQNEELHDRACSKLKLLLNQIAISERQEKERKLIEDNKMIGRVIQYQTNNFGHLSDIWEDGKLFDDLKCRKNILEIEKEAIENKKKELRKLKAKSNKNDKNDNDGFAIPKNKTLNKLLLDLEIVTIRLTNIKKQLTELEVEYSTLEYRKKLHIKFIRLMREEKKSRFSINKKHKCYVINKRYVLINLLGRGGFSEVHRGYDLIEHKYIAAKVHQLNQQWSDERKKNYTKHATREYDIHKSLNHENIVCLYDVFGIDVNSFCTVLEYCDGMDLDMYLKIKKSLSEKESKLLIIQVFKGLKYLHNSLPIIIHYDLKPGNLLCKNGLIKLTDFGLAKIMELDCTDASNGEIELTSQGAGTYWYLPPECFKSFSNSNNSNGNNGRIMISPKVDIWSAGVIFYQMLYGKKPFGDNLSQDTILNNKTILNAHNVIFPNQPRGISKQAKEFIQQCCAYDPKLRLSSNYIVDNHTYFDFLRK